MTQHDTVYILNFINENTGTVFVNVYSTYEKAKTAFLHLLQEKCPGKESSFYEEALARQKFWCEDSGDWCEFYGAEVM